jgi:histidyl-tRNA synthetase
VGIGFAAGLERLVLALPEGAGRQAGPPDAFVTAIGEPARDAAFQLVRELRQAGIRADIDYEGRSVRAQMKRADRLAAPLVVIIGDEELSRGQVRVKDMRSGDQVDVVRTEIIAFLRGRSAAAR